MHEFKIIGVNDNIQNLPDTFVATPNSATADINGINNIVILEYHPLIEFHAPSLHLLIPQV